MSIWDILVYIGLLVLGLSLFGFVYRIIDASDNTLEFWHFIATRNPDDGKHYADIDKLGKVVALATSSVVVIWMGYQNKIDATILGVYLAFAGGVAGYSAYLRAKAKPDEEKK